MPAAPAPGRRSAARLLLLGALVVLQVGLAAPAGAAPTPSPSPTASSSPGSATTAPSTAVVPEPAPAATAAPEVPDTLAAAGPTAVDDVFRFQAQRGPYSRDVYYAHNDRPGGAPLRLKATTFPDDQPAGARAAADHRSVQLGTLGGLVMEPGGSRMYFGVDTPTATGTATARYRIVDANGASSEALITVVVLPGGALAAVNVREGETASVDVLVNDVPGNNADGTKGTIDRTSVHFTTYCGGPGSSVSADGRTLVVPDKGTFSADPRTGVVTYASSKTYRGSPDGFGGDHVCYVARDTTKAADGTVRHQSYLVPIALGIFPVDPVAVPDEAGTPYDTPVTLPGTTNDSPGAPYAPIDLERTRFVAPDPGSTLVDGGRGLQVPHVGSWVVNPDGTFTFTPLPELRAGRGPETTNASYEVHDVNGGSARSSAYVRVERPPGAGRDTVTTAQNVDVAVDVLANDVPGRSADSSTGTLDRTSVHFPADGQPGGAGVSADGRRLTVPGQAVYTADPTTGTVTVDPGAAFRGTADPVRYTVLDTVLRDDGTPVHHEARGTLTATVTPITPVARDDRAVTTFGTPVRVRVLGNDSAGAASAPLDPASVHLRLASGLPAGSAVSANHRTLTLPGLGVFVAGDDGVVTFTPARGFAGRVPSVGYDVADTNGTRAKAPLTVRVDGAAVLRPTTATTRAGQPVVVDVLSNDDPPSGAGWDRSSVCLVVGSICVTGTSRAGVGSWDVDDQGTIAFAPLTTFTGDATITYRVRDTVVGTYSSTLTVSVAPAREALGD